MSESAVSFADGGRGPGSDVRGDDVLDPDVALERLRATLAAIGPCVVALSGGVDSALVARVAHDVHGRAAVAATAVSASLAAVERAGVERLVRDWGMEWQEVATDELGDARYVANGPDRCARCKSSLMDALGPVAAERGATVVLGVNLDDLDDHRPGQAEAARRGARFPLVEAGLDKAAVRAVSRRLGLATADKPAAACLASRIPYGTPVTVEALGRIGTAEAVLRRLGFEELRVRHYDDVARLEVPIDRLAELVARRDAVVEAVRGAGYRSVTVDLEGLRSGNLNDALRPG
jgi:uncharacterized protein